MPQATRELWQRCLLRNMLYVKTENLLTYNPTRLWWTGWVLPSKSPLPVAAGAVAKSDKVSLAAHHRVYDTFGKLRSETNAGVDFLFGFTGRPFDAATGLQNNLNRWYDPAVGRWLSPDPLGLWAGDANLYRYVGNRPTVSADPSGLFFDTIWDAGNIGVGLFLSPQTCTMGDGCTRRLTRAALRWMRPRPASLPGWHGQSAAMRVVR